MGKPDCLSKVFRVCMAIVLACGMMVPSVGYADADPQPQPETEFSNTEAGEESAPDVPEKPVSDGENASDDDSQDDSQSNDKSEADTGDVEGPVSNESKSEAEADQQKSVGDEAEGTALESNDDETAANGELSAQSLSFDGVNAITAASQSLDEATLQQAAEQGLVIEGTVVTDYTGNGGHVDIPEGVTEIGDYAFASSDVSSVSWPSTLKSIGRDAFNGTAIVELEVPAGLDYLGHSAFGSCDLLERVTVTELPAEMDSPAFGFSGKPIAFDIPDGIEAIPSSFFSYTSIGSLDIPSTVTTIGDHAFASSTGLGDLALPEGLETIGERAFEGYADLKAVYIPDSVISIGQNCFSENSKVVIYCSEGSVAHQYALDNRLNYSFGIIHTTHEYGEWTTQVDPTCTEPGTERRRCDCGAYEEREVPALGHNMGEWVVDMQPTLMAPGSQHRDCSRCSYSETQEIPQLTADLEAHPDYALATFHVVDAQTLANIEGASVTLQLQPTEGAEPADSQTAVTNAEGLAKVFVPSGSYSIQIEKDGYQLRGFEYELQPGETTLPDIGIATEKLVQGSLTVEEMTKEEIIDAGIDANAPDNQHVFKYEVTLVFQDGLEQIEIPSITYKNEKGEEVGGSFGGMPLSGGMTTIDLDPIDDEPVRICRVNEMLYIVIQGEAKWLKEMFHVQLLAVNTSQTDTVENAVATLELPEGISLAEMTSGEQSLSLELGSMAVGEQKSADWYVRGDATGDYTLTATLTGEMQPFGDSFTYTYQNEDPLHVYAGTDMKLTVHIDDAAYYEEPYTMYFQLENVSDHTIYDVTHKINNMSQYEVKEYTWIEDGRIVDSEEEWTLLDSVDFGDEATVTREEFKPGESLWVRVTTKILWESPLQSMVNTAGAINKVAGFLPLIGASVPAAAAPITAAAGIISDLDVRYWLSDTMVSTLEGSTTTIPVSFDVNHVEGVNLVDKVFEEITGISPDDVEGDLAEIVGNKTFSVLIGKENVSLAKFVYKETKSIMEVTLEDETTTCSAWVETVEGSNVLGIAGGGSSGGGATPWSVARASAPESGKLTLTGNTDLTVTALNPGVADLVVEDENGNIARKRFVVRDKLPAQEQFLPEGTDALQLDYVLLPGSTVLDEATATMYEQLGISLYSSAADDAQPVAVGSVIPNGAELRIGSASVGTPVVIPGDVNSDGLVDEADAAVMEDAETAASLGNEQRFAGDLNGDDIIDAQDAAILRAFLTPGGDEPEPEPTPDPGSGEDSGTDPEPGPDVEPDPGPGTDSDSGQEPDPGADPNPGEDPDQGTGSDPGINPDEEGASGEGDQPSADVPIQKDELAGELAGLVEQVESSKLPDTEKQELIEQIQAVQAELDGAAEVDALVGLQSKVEELSTQVNQSIEEAGKQEGAGAGQQSGDPAEVKPLETGESEGPSEKSSEELVSTGDASTRYFAVFASVAAIATVAACMTRRKTHMR